MFPSSPPKALSRDRTGFQWWRQHRGLSAFCLQLVLLLLLRLACSTQFMRTSHSKYRQATSRPAWQRHGVPCTVSPRLPLAGVSEQTDASCVLLTPSPPLPRAHGSRFTRSLSSCRNSDILKTPRNVLGKS